MRRAAAILALAFAAACTTAPPAPPPARTPTHVQLRETIAPGVHVLRQPGAVFAGVVGNVAIIEQADGLILVDSGSSHGAGVRVVEAVRAISALPVKAVIITHWHNDHPLGLSAIRAAWPDVEIIATQATFDAMQAGRLAGVPRQPSDDYAQARIAQLTAARDTLSANAVDESLSQREREQWALVVEDIPLRFADQAGTHLVLPTTTFTERHRIEDARTPVEAIFLGRANTDGDALIWLPRQRILIAGDTVVAPIPYMFSMYPEEHIAVLNRIQAMRPRLIVPGHGEVMRDDAYLDRIIGLIRDVQQRVGPLARADTPLADIPAQTDFSAQRAIFAGDDPWLAYWFDNYALTPLIASAYSEARGEPLGPAPLAAP